MARGSAEASTLVTTREHETEELFALLATCTSEAERETVTAELVELNLGLADALAHRYSHRGADREDLIQVARMALLLAVRRYRPGAGAAFAAFAVPTITGELKRYFRDHCWVVRPPRRIQELRLRAGQERRHLEQELGRPATPEELGHEIGVDPAQLRECAVADGSFRPWSLDVEYDSGDSLGSLLPDGDDAIEHVTDRLALQRVLAGLSRRERQMLVWRFQDGCTQAEIGRRLGISQMQVSRLIRGILDRTRSALTDLEPLAG